MFEFKRILKVTNKILKVKILLRVKVVNFNVYVHREV